MAEQVCGAPAGETVSFKVGGQIRAELVFSDGTTAGWRPALGTCSSRSHRLIRKPHHGLRNLI